MPSVQPRDPGQRSASSAQQIGEHEMELRPGGFLRHRRLRSGKTPGLDAQQFQGRLGVSGDVPTHQHLDTLELTELRDGFFDALFTKLPDIGPDELRKRSAETLPPALQPGQGSVATRLWCDTLGVLKRVTATRAGIKLLKSFLAFFIAYAVCLIPVARQWLGPQNYVLVVSAGIVNHPGRTVGAQLDGLVLTVLGTALGLGWGALGLLLSVSTATSRVGYGGILALFLVAFMVVVAFIRSYYIRFYQLVLCAGMAAIYILTYQVDGETIRWAKFYNFGIPWLLGQALALLISVVFFPDTGSEALAVSLHGAFEVMLVGDSHTVMMRKPMLTWPGRIKLAQG